MKNKCPSEGPGPSNLHCPWRSWCLDTAISGGWRALSCALCPHENLRVFDRGDVDGCKLLVAALIGREGSRGSLGRL